MNLTMETHKRPNFDTSVVMDVMELDENLKKSIISIIDEEQLFSDSIGQFNSDIFIESITPIILDHLKTFFKKDSERLKIPFLKKIVNLNNVDYGYIIMELTKI